MKPDIAGRADEDGAVRVEYQIRFSPGQGRKPRVRVAPVEDKPIVTASPQPVPHPRMHPRPKPALAADVPKLTRLLVLGHHFERMIHDGIVKDYAEIARLTGLTRARITQIVNLTLLAPDIQEDILDLSAVRRGPTPITERLLRATATHANWQGQGALWLKTPH